MEMFNSSEFLSKLPMLNGLFHYANALESSSDSAAELVRSGAPSGTLVLTESQTKGRGRGGNTWSCPRGEGLLFSLVLEPDIERSHWPRLALATGLAVAQAVETLGVEAKIKWPNDVWIGGKKCAGVLVEGCGDRVIVGVGINVSVRDFPADLKDSATSLALEGVELISREALLADVVKGIFRWGSRCGDDFSAVVDAVNGYCGLHGEMIQLRRESTLQTGMMFGLNKDGHLLLEKDGVVEQIAQADEVRKLRV